MAAPVTSTRRDRRGAMSERDRGRLERSECRWEDRTTVGNKTPRTIREVSTHAVNQGA